MMKLPRTQHIELSGKPGAETVSFENHLYQKYLVIEEKLDGTGVSIEFDQNLDLQILHRGTSKAVGSEYNLLYRWAEVFKEELHTVLSTRYIMFGEWLYNKHTIFYDILPCYYFESDIYDTENDIWLSTKARYDLLKDYRFMIASVPIYSEGKYSTIYQILSLYGPSLYRSPKCKEILQNQCIQYNYDYGQALEETVFCMDCSEGLYIKEEDDLEVINRYKYVPASFINTIEHSGHIAFRPLLPNKLKEL